MADAVTGAKIRLSGEKEFNAAIKEANRNLKTMKSELKATSAEMKNSASEEEKASKKREILNKQIKEQEKIVKALQEALKEAREEYKDNADVIAKWETKYNDARTTLANMKNSLADVGKAVEQTNTATEMGVVATKSFADAIGSVSQAAGSISDTIQDVFLGVVNVIRGAVTELWELTTETAARANNWTDIAGYWNTDASRIQKYAHAVEASANSFEDLNSAVTRIVLGGKGKDIAELLGISGENYTDQWQYAMAVMEQLSKISDIKERDNVLEKLFGEKRSTKVIDLLNDWETIQKNLATFDADNGGFGMDEETLKTMDQVYVKIREVEEKWKALKEEFAGGFGEIALKLTTSVSGSLDALNDYMNADNPAEKEEALNRLRNNVTTFFEQVADAIREGLAILNEVGKELAGSDDPIVSAIGQALTGITTALDWMMTHIEEVKTALGTFFGLWMTGKGAEFASQIASIASNIATIRGFSALGSLGKFGGAAAASTAAEAATLTSTLGSILSTLTTGIMIGGFAAGAIAMVSRLIQEGNKTPEQRETERVLNEANEKTPTEQKIKNASDPAVFRDLISAAFDPQKWQEENKKKREAAAAEEAAKAAAELANKLDVTNQQYELMETWWDVIRSGRAMDDTVADPVLDAIESAIPDELWDKFDRLLMEWDDGTHNDVKNLPQEWFLWPMDWESDIDRMLENNNSSMKSIPGQTAAAVRAGMSGISVVMDGQTVGRLVAPYVSQSIGSLIVMP